MDLNRKNMKQLFALIAFGIILYLGLNHMTPIRETIGQIFRMLLPFIIGSGIAFILNVPMRAIERTLFAARPGRRAPAWKQKFRRPISLILTLAAVAGAVAILVFTIWPQIVTSTATLRVALPAFAATLTEWANDLVARYPEIETYVQEFLTSLSKIDWQTLLTQIVNFLRSGNLLNNTVSLASTIIGGITNVVLGFIFAIYVLLQKERLASGCKKLLYAWLPEQHVDTAIDILRLAQKTFSSFISGQCLEACILGVMFFLAMGIFHMPYATVVGTVIAVTALIPIFGAFIGCFVGAFLILIVNPMQALWFIVLFLVLQQIEGNLIYPHVVGGSVGLPSIWVLVAVTTGASTMGVIGMLINIPLFSVLYTLLRRYSNEQIRKKKIASSKLK